jgi:hypothetical protein
MWCRCLHSSKFTFQNIVGELGLVVTELPPPIARPPFAPVIPGSYKLAQSFPVTLKLARRALAQVSLAANIEGSERIRLVDPNKPGGCNHHSLTETGVEFERSNWVPPELRFEAMPSPLA